MRVKISLGFGWVSVVLACNMATRESGQVAAGLAGALVCICHAAAAEAGQPGGASTAARGGPAEPANPPRELRFSPEPTDAEISAARVFDEPLVPVDAQPVGEENQALAAALTAYAMRATPDDCSRLAAYLEAFPNSRWSGPLLLHLGTEYYNYGYFSKALGAWEGAWQQLEPVRHAPAKPEADRALGELARMYSRLGRVAELSRLLEASGDRDLAGPATQLIHAAKGALWMMQNKPDYCFRCGPLAVDRILMRLDPSRAQSPVLEEYKSTTNGFSLPQVAQLSARLGMNYQMAFRNPEAPFIVPAVVHWKVNHYAALVERRGERILAQDYTFRGSIWMTPPALEQEGSGYFLVPPGTLPAGWRPVSAAEGQRVWGRGFVGGQDANATSGYDTTCGGPTCAKCRRCRDKNGNVVYGMTTYTMHALLVSLTLNDTPLSVTTPIGPQVGFTATYNQLEANQPAVFYYSNLGQKWDCNWVSYVTDNPATPGADVSLYLDGGGTLSFTGFNPATQTYSLEPMSQTVLVRKTSSSYQLQYPDGSLRQYAGSDGAVGSTRRIFLTQVIDRFGNAIQFQYDAQLRITNVVNAIGRGTTVLYTNAAYPFQITDVIDPFGRAAHLQYNAAGLLTEITDVLGMVSQYAYGTNQFVTALTTPYGTTTFATGQTNGGTYLLATDPLGASELLEFSQASGIPHSLPASQVPHGLSTFNLFIDGRDSLFGTKRHTPKGPGITPRPKSITGCTRARAGPTPLAFSRAKRNRWKAASGTITPASPRTLAPRTIWMRPIPARAPDRPRWLESWMTERRNSTPLATMPWATPPTPPTPWGAASAMSMLPTISTCSRCG